MMTNQRCPICGRPHAPGACPTSGAGSGAPRSILGAAAVPLDQYYSVAGGDPGLALLADAGLQGAADQYAALKRDGRTHAEALYAVLSDEIVAARSEAPVRGLPPLPGSWADDVQHWQEATREVPRNLAVGLGVAINSRIAARYDELMREGRHGHYETMFRVMAEELAVMMAAPPPPPTLEDYEKMGIGAPTGPAPWMAPRGECRSCDRRRDSHNEAGKKKANKTKKASQ